MKVEARDGDGLDVFISQEELEGMFRRYFEQKLTEWHIDRKLTEWSKTALQGTIEHFVSIQVGRYLAEHLEGAIDGWLNQRVGWVTKVLRRTPLRDAPKDQHETPSEGGNPR